MKSPSLKQLGLIGYPLTHSFSVGYFREKFEKEDIKDFSYSNFQLASIKDFTSLLVDQPELYGLNVTIPYKQQIIEYLDELDELSSEIQAVNTIRISRNEKGVYLKGYNTDVYGFYHSLKPMLSQVENSALVLGTGGASRAIVHALKLLGIEHNFVSRNPRMGMLGYRDICLPVLKKYNILINTSPVGTYPETNEFPDIPYDLLDDRHILYDLVYNPPETKFMELGRLKGAKTINGLKMLKLQAEKSWEIWTGDPDRIEMI